MSIEVTSVKYLNKTEYDSITPLDNTLYLVNNNEYLSIFLKDKEVKNVLTVDSEPVVGSIYPGCFYIVKNSTSVSLYYSYTASSLIPIFDSSVVSITKVGDKVLIKDRSATEKLLVGVTESGTLFPESINSQISGAIGSQDLRYKWIDW